AVQGSMSFLQEFLQKKYGWGIVFFTLIFAGLITAIAFYNNGLKVGKENAADEIKSLRQASANDNEEIKNLKKNIAYYKTELDSCNKSSANSNLEDLVNRKLEEAER